MFGYRRRTNAVYALFLLVPAILFAGAYVYPVAATVQLSAFSWDGMSPERSFVGWANYLGLLHEPRVLHAFANNLKWLVYFLLVPTVVGLGLALLLDSGIKGTYVLRTVFFLPFTITTVAVASTWRWIYDPHIGLLTETLRAIGLGGLARNWLGDPAINSYSIMGASLWAWSGFTFLIYFAGLRNLPTDIVDAARIDGATGLAMLTRIKLPLLLPSTIVIIGVAGVDAMRVFDIVWAMTQGGPYDSSSVLAVEMYQTSFARFDLGAGAAIAVVLLVLAGIIVMPYIYYL
ncbi:MAG: sugar ABC transporter permease, partial [Acetobacteraceae bacterium]|nr:sugar ABC transporter permease [Acetobacteraceae bacterium]